MKTLEQEMATYAAYHQDARNKATHFVGVPLIMLALLVPLSWPSIDFFGFKVTAAMLLAGALLAYYFVLDFALAAAMLAVLGALIWLAELIAAGGAARAWTWFGVLFAGGWVLQLVGHAFEGRRPALVDNLFQIFVAPIFLCAEIFFALGLKPGLRSAVRTGSGN
ncbi:MAG TPA: Mpo1-like protein [Burkholderiales bacterium]